ncbi:homeobox protein Mohawk-like isoform X2 [Acipenser ruthenus]|uniref:homeobox protein Mohawk-like isoform X2 n=1 Tax=Acipenser ruthenus TaxID=7906 RepID=UPI002741A706|nr:homeobox protein Mohawk-like isoform X2 [Acipenser ruthenus]
MNTIVFNKLSGQMIFEEKAKEVERSSRNYLEVIDGQHPDMMIPNSQSKENARHRRSGSRQNGGKVRHKRQALQDMARPLKQWLYKHRDNPYPTKTEKILLALGSQMTLVQVSNWFANARRRLKNTVRQPDLSWALRIKLYNKYVQGNAERLSVSSDDTCSEDGEHPPRNQANAETVEHGSSKCDNGTKEKGTCKDETYWREINAAMALTNLAQGKDKVSGTTSCIIQKSSHISEIKTVKVPLAQTF